MNFIKSSQEMLDSLKEKGATPERILEVMMNRGDRHLAYYNREREQRTEAIKELRELQRLTGRLITVNVDHIAHDTWGKYTWYKGNKYRWNGDLWVKNDSKNTPHYMAKHRHGKFKVTILLAEEDMPEVFVGECRGNIMGKKVILSDGHMINHGDKFEIRKLEEKKNG